MNQSAPLVPPRVSARARPAGRIPIAFGRRFFLLLLLGLIWIGPAWWDRRFLYGMAAWDALVLALWWWDLARLPGAERFEIERRWSAPLGLATPGIVELALRNQGKLTISASVVDNVPAGLRRTLPRVDMTAPAGGVGISQYEICPRERGDAQAGDVTFRYQGPLQLAERWAAAPLAQTVRVYPNLEETKRNSIYLLRGRQIEQQRRRERRRGRGREFESLREYHEGDEWRDICWTATARRGKLISKLYRTERSQTVWLVLDAGRLLRARVTRVSKLDFAVNAALNVARVALYSGDRVALLAYGRRPQQRLAPGRGATHLRTLVECLSQVRGEAVEADHLRATEALLALQKRRSLIVWFTDLSETATTPEVIECASRISRRHLVLFVVMGQRELAQVAAVRPGEIGQMYRYVAAQEVLQRRDLLLRQLRLQGVLAVEVEPARLSTAVVNHYLEIKERTLL